MRLGFYFADLIFVVCQSTAKIGSLENFRLYGIYTIIHAVNHELHTHVLIVDPI